MRAGNSQEAVGLRVGSSQEAKAVGRTADTGQEAGRQEAIGSRQPSMARVLDSGRQWPRGKWQEAVLAVGSWLLAVAYRGQVL